MLMMRAGPPCTYLAGMRQVTLPIALLVAVASGVVLATPAHADQPRFRVESAISLGLHDDENFPDEDERCGFGGTTSQHLKPSDGNAQLGAGKPEADYHWNRGPFRNQLGDAILYLCGGEVSLCFHPSRATVSNAGDLTITLAVTFFEGSTIFGAPALACAPRDLKDSRTVVLSVPGGTRRCLGSNVVLKDNSGDSATIGSFCASSTRDGTAPDPPPPPPTVAAFHCDSLEASFTCDVSHSGGTGAIQVQWFVNGRRVSAFDDALSVTRSCTLDATVQVRVVVVDSTNASAERSLSFRCIEAGS
jgi:hypothetical protein